MATTLETLLLGWFALTALGVTLIVAVCCRPSGSGDDESGGAATGGGLSSPSR